jgi:hypothetical protein
MNSSEEAKQLRNTAKDMLEAIRQCIYIMKDSELSEGGGVMSGHASLEPTPPPPDEDILSGGNVETVAKVQRSSAMAENAGDNR